MTIHRSLLPGAVISVALAVAAGCSKSDSGRREVKGVVKLQGQPLKDGSITFVPLDGDTQSGSGITNGVYHLPRANGLKPGKYLVQISSGDGKTPANEDVAAPGGSTNIVSWDLIPDDWNINSNQQVEVKSDGDNTFDFNIPNANTPRKRQ